MEFDPENRPGIFNKTITVFSNAGNGTVTLSISGTVIPFKTDLKIKLGELRLSSRYVEFGQVKDSEVAVDTLEIQNSNDSVMSLTAGEIPSYIDLPDFPLILKPHERRSITIILAADKKEVYGRIVKNIPLQTELQGKKGNIDLKLTAEVVEDFSKLTEQERKNAPKIVSKKDGIDIGKVKKGTTKSLRIEYRNEGKRNLEIRRIVTARNCSVVSFDKVVKPAESGSADIDLKADYFSAKFEERIQIISNDPGNSVKTIKITGRIK